MPQVAVCKDCGYVLYRGVELKSAEEIIQMVGGRCPKCGRKLSFSVEDVEVRPSK
ncbi:MAG: hypothetical protein ACXQTV_02065 [Candidatus Hecatellaceae archaeon]